MSFHVGQKVVCINDTDGYGTSLGAGYTCGLRNGSVYTITHIFRQFLSLAEIKQEGWHVDRFCPVVERKTDISVFTRMLTPTKERVS